jgi:hypothetical protein
MFLTGLGLDLDRWLESCWVVGAALVDSGCLVVRFADGAERGKRVLCCGSYVSHSMEAIGSQVAMETIPAGAN